VVPKTLVPVALSDLKVASFESVEVKRVIVDGGLEANEVRILIDPTNIKFHWLWKSSDALMSIMANGETKSERTTFFGAVSIIR